MERIGLAMVMQVLARYGGAQASKNWAVIATLGGMLLGLVVILGVLVLWFRKRYIDQQGPEQTEPLTLGDLRDLHEKGMIDDQEFKRLRDMIIHEARSSAGLDAESADAPPPPRSDNRLTPIGADGPGRDEPPAPEPDRQEETPPPEPEQAEPDL